MKARPVSLRIRFFASSAITATTARVKKYLRAGVSNGTPRITMC
jgi:hypothetical protein